MLRAALALGVATMAASCDELAYLERPTLAAAAEVAPASVVETGRAWVHAPEAILVTARIFGTPRAPVREQRILLPNKTTVPGDNVIVLRASPYDSTAGTAFLLQPFLEQAGGVPPPFAPITESGLMSRDDALGGYVWKEEFLGVGTICVLAFRRLTRTSRPLPQGADVMDVMVRNCVDGTLDEALAPITAPRVGFFAGSEGHLRRDSVRTLSPFAAPRL
ncbi:MAG: hypothetical protein JJU40_03950 [Rhodobacteraceae bacterium]|nr:hypothetical protein [Paracoccaceae bacterium]